MRFEKKSNVKTDEGVILSVMKDYGLSREVVEIIMSRGYVTKNQIANFLEPEKFNYYNPYLLKNMNKAVEIIKSAVKNKQKITVLGDYDTDGICSTAILYKYFESVGITVDYFLPNRFVDGYGLTFETVDKIKSQFNPDLLITVDCGISSYKEIEYAQQLGITVIVTDHHEIPENVPNCVVVNPKQKEQEYPFSELCGAGVALKLVQALAGFGFAKKLISIASFATIADIVPLVDENRAIVFDGIKNYKRDLPIGVLRLIDKFNITNLQPGDVSFRVAPKINTAGRMGDASVAFKLFIEKDISKIEQNIEELQALNEIRVNDGLEIYDEALEMLKDKPISKMKAIVLYKDEWNGGVLGIVCAKLVDKYNKPVFLFSKIENEYKGSARSIEKIDIYQELSNLSDILIRFGGHSQAGGLSIEGDKLPEFEKRLNENLSLKYSESDFEPLKYYDLCLNNVKINNTFLQQLQKLEPFGFGNEKPIFKISFNSAKVNQMKNFDAHLKLQVGNLDIVAFNYIDYYSVLKASNEKEALIEINTTYKYKNKNLINAKLLNLKISPLTTSFSKETSNYGIVNQLKFYGQKANKNYVVVNDENEQEISDKTFKNSLFGTLVVSSHFVNYKKFVDENGKYFTNYELFEVNTKSGENTVLYAPNNLQNISGFENVIFLEPILDIGYLNNLNINNVYIANNYKNKTTNSLKGLDISRKTFAVYHTAIVNFLKSDQHVSSEKNLFDKIVKFNPQFKSLKLDQFAFVLTVLQELEIIKTEQTSEEFKLILNDIKNPLENSKVYNFVKFINKVS